MNTYIYIQKHTDAHMYLHKHIYLYMHVYTHHIHTHTHTPHMHTHTCARAHAHAHTHAHYLDRLLGRRPQGLVLFGHGLAGLMQLGACVGVGSLKVSDEVSVF